MVWWVKGWVVFWANHPVGIPSYPSPRRPAARRPAPNRPRYVRVLDSTNGEHGGRLMTGSRTFGGRLTTGSSPGRRARFVPDC